MGVPSDSCGLKKYSAYLQVAYFYQTLTGIDQWAGALRASIIAWSNKFIDDVRYSIADGIMRSLYIGVDVRFVADGYTL